MSAHPHLVEKHLRWEKKSRNLSHLSACRTTTPHPTVVRTASLPYKASNHAPTQCLLHKALDFSEQREPVRSDTRRKHRHPRDALVPIQLKTARFNTLPLNTVNTPNESAYLRTPTTAMRVLKLHAQHPQHIRGAHTAPADTPTDVTQHSTTLTANPPAEVSLYFESMSLPVCRIVSITASNDTV